MPAPHHMHGRPNAQLCARCSIPTRGYLSRGLCNTCYQAVSRSGQRIDFAPHHRPRDELMHEWELLRGEGYTKRQAAERLGMTFAAFDRAFHRARLAGDPRARPALRAVRMTA